MKVTIVGTGYVGLVSGTCFAQMGNEVTCVDVDAEKIEKMQAGEIPIFEPGLKKIFRENIRANRLRFTTDLAEGIAGSTLIFLALPTPPNEDGSADLSYVLKVAEDLSEIMTDYKVIVNKSTVPVGTAEKVTAVLKAKAKVPFDVVSNPEFLREGLAVEDFLNPSRVIVGSSSEKATQLLKELYQPITSESAPFIVMDEKSSELTKYAANSFLAVKITFMNEVANYCEKVGANVDDVRIGMGADERIGSRFLYPGIGYGGSCFPKDVKALLNAGKSRNFDFKLLKAVEEVNQKQKVILIKAIKAYFKGDLKGKEIALWGLAFKPNTDDIREASSLDMIAELLAEGASVTAYDPEAMSNVKAVLGDEIKYAESAEEAIKGKDFLLIATEWQVFKDFDLESIKSLLNEAVIFDGRNIYDVQKMKDLGFYYKSIGR